MAVPSSSTLLKDVPQWSTTVGDLTGGKADRASMTGHSSGEIATLDSDGDPVASGKTVVTTLGSDDATVPTSKAVKDVADGKRDKTDNVCHQTSSGFTPWRATLQSGYTFGDDQPAFNSTTNKWTWYVEGSGVSVDAESGASTASATSATFSFTDGTSGTITFDAVRSSQPSTENETFATADYVDKKVGSFLAVGGATPTVTSGVADLSTLFTSANTSLTGTIKDCGGVQHDSDGYFIETEV